MTLIRFLRHAESEFNVDADSKALDCSLTPFGRLQASLIQGDYRDWTVIVSPLRRARETLECSRIIYKEVTVLSTVREYRHDYCDFLDSEECLKESDDDLMNRADLFLKEIRHFEKVLVISHCEFIHSITAVSLHNTEWIDININTTT